MFYYYAVLKSQHKQSVHIGYELSKADFLVMAETVKKAHVITLIELSKDEFDKLHSNGGFTEEQSESNEERVSTCNGLKYCIAVLVLVIFMLLFSFQLIK